MAFIWKGCVVIGGLYAFFLFEFTSTLGTLILITMVSLATVVVVLENESG